MKLVPFIFNSSLCCHPLVLIVGTNVFFSDRRNLLLLVFLFLFILLLIFFFLRIRSIKKHNRELSKRLDQRASDLIMRENNLLSLRNEIEDQIRFCDDQNELIHSQTIELDINRHQLEKIIESKTNELKIAKDRAEESDRLKTSFLENISHEVRTPMNAIMGFVSLLNEADVNAASKAKYVSRINKNCLVLLQLIEDILVMSKIHAEQLQIKKERFSVNEVMVSLFKEYSEEKQELELNKIELMLNIPDMEYFLYTDLIRFKQVMSKLIGNAFKYTEKGKIEFGYKPIYKSEFEKEPSFLQFEISDTGIGIPQSKLDFIFSRFSKIETDKSKLYRGAGLGLFISKNLAELMGGQLWVNSKLKEGSTFHFSLPYFETEGQKTRTLKKKSKGEKQIPVTYSWQNKTILVAEDEHNNFIYLHEIIKRTGATTIEAKNGIQAVEIVRDNTHINIVLMDLLMPEMDGYIATRKIKEIRPSLPVIAQTAYSMTREREKSLEAGCDGYISKPYDPPELLELISHFI